MASKENINDDIATLSFEQALSELDGIVERLEAGNVSLEESIDIFDGVVFCYRLTDNTPRRTLWTQTVVLRIRYNERRVSRCYGPSRVWQLGICRSRQHRANCNVR